MIRTWFCVDVFSLTTLAVIFFGGISLHSGFFRRQHTFVGILFYTFGLVVAHMVMSFGLDSGNVGMQVLGNTVNFALNPGVILLWLIYASSFVDDEVAVGRLDSFKDVLVRSVLAIVVVNVILSLVNLGTGWYFFYDAAGAYQHGPLFVPRFLILGATALQGEIMLYLNRRRIGMAAYPWLATAPLFPLVGALAQGLFDMLPLELAGDVLGVSLMHLLIQERTSAGDALTGVGNRRALETGFDALVRRVEEGSSFSALMLDVDQFKQINDTYGHGMGDEALRAVTTVLRTSFHARDLVARMGGDEFYVLSTSDDPAAMRASAARVRAALVELNATRRLPFVIRVSMGYGVYDPVGDGDVEGFRKRLDDMIYEEKARKGALRE